MSEKLKKDLLPVYAIVGDDKLKSKVVLERLSKRMEEFGDMSFNSSTFDGEKAIGTEITSACMQIPFASEKRFVVVKNADKLKKDDAERIVEYLENPNPTTILALVCTKLAKNSRLFKACTKISNTSIIDCSSVKTYLVADSLNNIARSHGGGIDKNAAQRLVELVGPDTLKLDAEIQKLLLSNGNQNITLQQVNDEVQKSAESKPWDFTNAFAARDLNKCLQLFQEMSSGSEYMLLPQTCKIVKELICVQDLGQVATQNAISQALGYEA